MAQLKSNSTVDSVEMSNINLDNLARSAFSAGHLTQIRGTNGTNGTNGTAASMSKSGTTLSATGKSDVDLSNITDVVYGGSNRGHCKIYLNGTRIYEKYETTENYQEWVESGYYENYSETETRFTQWSNYWMVQDGGSNNFVQWGGSLVAYNFAWATSRGAYSRGAYQVQVNNEAYHSVSKTTTGTRWVDTSGYETFTRTVDAYYY